MTKISKKEKLEILKVKVLFARFSPTFEADYEAFRSIKHGCNCYAYALQLPVYLEGYNDYNPGFLSDIFIKENDFRYQKKILKGLYEDCKILGIDIEQVEKDTKLSSYSYKIALGYGYDARNGNIIS